MNYSQKKIIVLLIFGALFNILKGEDFTMNFPQGLGRINITSVADNGHRVLGEMLTPENFKKWLEKGHFPEIKTMINDANIVDVVKYVHEVTFKGWRDALKYTTELIDQNQFCPEFKNAHSGKAYNEFIKWINAVDEDSISLIFNMQYSRATSGARTNKKSLYMANSYSSVNIEFPKQQFIELIEYIVDKLKSNPKPDISDYVTYKKNHYLLDLLFHEMLHAFTDTFWTEYDGIDEDVIECEVYCLQKACLENVIKQWLPDYKTPEYSKDKCKKNL